MKKILAAMLSLFMLVSAAGCFGSEKDKKPESVSYKVVSEAVEDSVSKCRTGDKTTVTIESAETLPEGTVNRKKIEYVFDNTARTYLMSVYAREGLAADAVLGDTDVVSRMYCTPAPISGVFNVYYISYEDGVLDAEFSTKNTATEAYVQACMFSYLGDVTATGLSLVPFAFYSVTSIRKAVREEGAIVIDETLKSGLFSQMMDLSVNLTYGVKGRIEADGQSDLTVAYARTTAGEKTAYEYRLTVRDGAFFPMLDVEALVDKETYTDDDAVYVLTQFIDLYSGIETKEGSVVNASAYFTVDDGSWLIYEAEKATVYCRYFAESETYRTYYDFTDLTEKDVYYEEYFDSENIREEIGAFAAPFQWMAYAYEGTVRYDRANGYVYITREDSSVTLTLNAFSMIGKACLQRGSHEAVDTYALGTVIDIPRDYSFSGFIPKTVA